MDAKAAGAARLLAALANPKRLLAFWHLIEGEKSVGQLAELVGLLPTALSQHLARMPGLALVDTRREGQTIYRRMASAEVRTILEPLYRRTARRPPAWRSADPASPQPFRFQNRRSFRWPARHSLAPP